MAPILGIPRLRSAFYRMRKSTDCAEHLYWIYYIVHISFHQECNNLCLCTSCKPQCVHAVFCAPFYHVQRTSGFDLYSVFDPLIAKSQAILLGNKLIRWISVRFSLAHTRSCLQSLLYYSQWTIRLVVNIM